MTGRTGRLLSNENFCNNIENLGDAYEAAEECFGMVWWLAGQLAQDDTRVSAAQWVERAEQNYKDGLRLGGGQRER